MDISWFLTTLVHYFHFQVGRTLHLDGLLSSRGLNATTWLSSGGSGGSILIEATNFTGHGELSVRGGDGKGASSGNAGLGAGGGGGRVGAHIRHQNNYGGLYTTEGGQGFLGTLSSRSTSKPVDGSAGTIYKYESRRGPQYRELKYANASTAADIEANFKPDHSLLKVDAGLRPGFTTSMDVTSLPTMVMENGTTFYEFDEVQLHGPVSVIFYHKNVSSFVLNFRSN